MPVTLEEKIEILVLLASDQAEEIRGRALETLQGWNARDLRQLLSSSTTSPAVLGFAARNLATSRQELVEALLANPILSSDAEECLLANLATTAAGEAPSESVSPRGLVTDANPSEEKRKTLIQKISSMSVVEKIKLALTGNLESRMILVRDPNKLVARCVLQSPKVTDSEVESYASATNVTEEVLRLLALSRKYMKSYAVVRTLVNNPRAPIDITLPLLKRLNDKDLKGLTINRNVPEVLRGMSSKMIKQRELAKKPTGKY